MSKNDLGCDVHMYQEKPNAKNFYLWLQFLGGVMCFHLIQETYIVMNFWCPCYNHCVF